MAYVEIRKSGKLIARRPVDERQARTGLRVRVGSAGAVRVALGRPATLGDFEIEVCAGEPDQVGQDAGRIVSEPSTGEVGGSRDAQDRPGEGESMRDLGFSAPGAARLGGSMEAPPEIEGYRVLGPIGRGGMGTVWRAEQLSTHRQVALKLMTARGPYPDKAQARFEREVELTAKLDHPHIGRIYDSGLCQGMCYYAMEFIDGMPLDRYVQRMALPVREILVLMRSICQAVHYAHLHGIIHRDLKPANIIVGHDGQPHVLDFGLARSFLHEEEAVTISLEGEVAGTPAYMAPEQARGHSDQIDTRTDVFSLGVILYQLLTGRPPHDLSGSVYEVLQRVIEGKIMRPRAASPSLDRELEAILLRALATDLASRYASAGELADDLDNYLTGEPLRARVPTTFYFLSKRVRKHWKQVGVAVAVSVVVLGTILVAYTRVVGEQAVSRAEKKRLEGRLDEAAAKLQEADLKAMILGKDKKKAEAALDLLVDRYLTAEDKVSQLHYQLGQRPTTVPARGIGLQTGKPLGKFALVRTPSLPGQVVTWTLEPQGHRAGVVRLVYSPDGSWLASAGQDGTIRLWDSQTGQLSGVLLDPNGLVADLVWSDESRNLRLSDPTGAARWWAWDSSTRTFTPIPPSPQQSPTPAAAGLSWSRTADVASPSLEAVLSRWNVGLRGGLPPLCRTAACMALSEDKSTLAVADADGAISFLEVGSGLVKTAGTPAWCGPVTCAAFSPKGDLFATCSGAGTLCLWDAHTWQPLREFPAATVSAGSSSGPGVFCWAPDGQALALARDPAGAVEIMEVQSGRVLRRLTGKDQRITSVAWSADASTLVAGTANGTLLVWDVDSASPVTYRETIIGGSNVRAALLRADPLRVVAANAGGKVELWDVREGRLLKPLVGPAGAANCLALAGDEKTMASAGSDQTVRLWDLQAGGLLRAFPSDPNRPPSKTWGFSALAWSPDGRRLAAGASDGWIVVWEAEARSAVKSFEAHCGSVTSLAWSRDGQLLLCGGSDGTARAWDVKNGFREYAVLLPLWGPVGTGVVISPEGDYRGPPEIEDHLVYVVQTDKGHKMLSSTEFRAQHGWVNEPWQVGLYRPGTEAVKRIYVRADAPGPFDGQSWATAFNDLQDALSAAQPDTEIWVTAGVYRPARGTGARTASFHLKDGVRLFGGFAGTETRVHERDPNRHETILSGDLKGDDKPDFANNDENSYHVVTGLSNQPDAGLDGFVIAGGNADGPEEGGHRFGGGMYNRGRPRIVNCVFRYNSAADRGGGMDNDGVDDWTLTGCRFISNRVTDDDGGQTNGGGLSNIGCNLVVDNCTFIGNSAAGIGPGTANGGGMYTGWSKAKISRCSFVKNVSRGTGGGMFIFVNSSTLVTECSFIENSAEGYGGGGIWCHPEKHEINPTFVDCVFINNRASQGGGMVTDGGTHQTLIKCRFLGNSAEWGGGIYNIYGCSLVLSDCLFSGNSANSGGAIATGGGAQRSDLGLTNCTLARNVGVETTGGIFAEENGCLLTMANCILWGNTDGRDSTESAQIRPGKVIISNCCVQGWSGTFGGTANSGLDPLFVDPNGPDGKIGTLDDNLRLGPGSPCRDAGDNSALPVDTLDLDRDGDLNEPTPVDLDARPRVQNGRVDIGAYESDPFVSGGRQ